MHYSLKKFSIFLFVVWFHSIPSSLSQTHSEQHQNLAYQSHVKEYHEIRRMEEGTKQKLKNVGESLKNGDTINACRNLFVVVDLFKKIDTRWVLYGTTYRLTADGEIALSERRSGLKHILNLAENMYAKYCGQSQNKKY